MFTPPPFNSRHAPSVRYRHAPSVRERRTLLLAVTALALCTAFTVPQARESQADGRSQDAPSAAPSLREWAPFTVYVDPPTGFVFVKLPVGWKFVGRVDERQVRQLGRGQATQVVTRLLPSDAGAVAELRSGALVP